MKKSENIKNAVFNMGGVTRASRDLNVSTSAVNKWIRNGIIPNLDRAKQVANASGFDVAVLRPRLKQETV